MWKEMVGREYFCVKVLEKEYRYLNENLSNNLMKLFFEPYSLKIAEHTK